MLETVLNYLSLRMLEQFRESLLALHIHETENSENDLAKGPI